MTTIKKERVKRAPEGETEADKFKRIAGYRLNNALTDIKLITNCFGPGYVYKQEQVDKIVALLQEGIDAVKESAASGGKDKANRIEL